jgi:hypothetical protein
MKKIISLFAILFLFNACTPDEGISYSLKLMPIQSVDIPTEFTLGQTYPITVYYTKPTNCYIFNQLYYEKDLNVRTVAVECAVQERNNCVELSGANAEASYTFDFIVTSNGSYKFKFYQGKDPNGENVFLEYEVPVVN